MNQDVYILETVKREVWAGWVKSQNGVSEIDSIHLFSVFNSPYYTDTLEMDIFISTFNGASVNEYG